MLINPVQTTLNSNIYHHETINIKEHKEKLKRIRTELNKINNHSFYIKRPKRKNRNNTSLQMYRANYSLQINNKTYESVSVGICNNRLYLYIFSNDHVTKFRVKDIETFELINLN